MGYLFYLYSQHQSLEIEVFNRSWMFKEKMQSFSFAKLASEKSGHAQLPKLMIVQENIEK